MLFQNTIGEGRSNAKGVPSAVALFQKKKEEGRQFNHQSSLATGSFQNWVLGVSSSQPYGILSTFPSDGLEMHTSTQ